MRLSAGRTGAARIARISSGLHKIRHEKSPIYFLFFTCSSLHPSPSFAIITFAQQNIEFFDTKYRFGLCLMAETVFGVFFCVHLLPGCPVPAGVLCRPPRAVDFLEYLPPGLNACYLYMDKKATLLNHPGNRFFLLLFLFFYLIIPRAQTPPHTFPAPVCMAQPPRSRR